MKSGDSRILFFNENYMEKIRRKYDTFSPTEQIVAKYIVSNGSECANMSIQELSEKTGCSSATIMRFCRTAGYSGFSELKFLIKEMSSDFAKDNLSLSYNDNADLLKKKILQFTQYSINETVDVLDSSSLDRASTILANARKIVFCSMGSACGVALAATNHFLSLGKDAAYFSDDLLLLRSAVNLSSNDVIIGINYDGYSRSVADAFKLAKENGATTILMSSFDTSLIAKYADIILRTPVRNNSNILNFSTTTICQMMIVQLLVSGTWQYGGVELDERSKQMRTLTNTKRYPKHTTAI